jgi:hypothetical protein
LSEAHRSARGISIDGHGRERITTVDAVIAGVDSSTQSCKVVIRHAQTGELVRARQAAWALSGAPEPPDWGRTGVQTFDGDVVPAVRDRYAEARELTLARQRSVADVAALTEHWPASPTR